MSFESILSDIVASCDGAVGAALVHLDGIPVEQVVAGRLPSGPLSEDFATAGVELSRILSELSKTADALAGGGLQELTVTLQHFTAALRTVDAETFLIVLLEPDGNLGKARYLMRRNLLALRQEL